MQPLWQ